MANIDAEQILAFLQELGNRSPQTATVYLLGGSALCLLGNPRPTLDIDYVGNDLIKNPLQLLIEQVAQEMQVEVKPVPIEEFVPIPTAFHTRNIRVGRFGTIDVYILDPYTIALSKLDRGLDTDIEDVLFLLHHDFITLAELESVIDDALERAQGFDIIPDEIRQHLEVVRSQFH